MPGQDFSGSLVRTLAHIPAPKPVLPLIPGKPGSKLGMPLQPTQVLQRVVVIKKLAARTHLLELVDADAFSGHLNTFNQAESGG